MRSCPGSSWIVSVAYETNKNFKIAHLIQFLGGGDQGNDNVLVNPFMWAGNPGKLRNRKFDLNQWLLKQKESSSYI